MRSSSGSSKSIRLSPNHVIWNRQRPNFLAPVSGLILATLIERFTYSLRVAGDDGQVGARRLIRRYAALLPIAQRTNRNVIARREVFLADAKRAPNDFHLRRALHAAQIGRRQAPVVAGRAEMIRKRPLLSL